MRTVAAVTAAVMLTCAGAGISTMAHAFNEPDAFRDVPWGASEEVVRQTLTIQTCMETTTPALGDRLCRTEITIAAIPVTAYVWFRTGGMTAVDLYFSPDRFALIEAAFVERYGPPTERTTEPFVTRGGLRDTNARNEWVGDKVFIRLSKYVGKITQSGARIQTQADRAEEHRQMKDLLKTGAKDL